MNSVDASDRPISGQERELREQLSNLQGLLMLSMLMTESDDENQILQIATTSVPSFGRARFLGVRLVEGDWRLTAEPCTRPHVRAAIERRLRALGRNGGAITVPDHGWAWALPLQALPGHYGHVVVGAPEEPPQTERLLLQVLAQQTGVALAHVRLHAGERAQAEELRRANAALAETVAALEHKTRIHVRLTGVAAADEGEEGIAQALHELTGFSVAIEDRHGNPRAWVGPGRPEPYPKDSPERRERLLSRVLRERRPVRERDRLLAVASPRSDVLGVLALIDPAHSAGDRERVALEHGATVLAMELAHQQSMAEAELRLRRDLVEDLLAGTDEDGALTRARALGHDLQRPHRVVVVEGRGPTMSEGPFFHAVRRQARALGAGAMLVSRGGSVVILADVDVAWDRLREAILAELGGGRCRIGVGGVCERPTDFPRSHHEAGVALKTQRIARGVDRVTRYDELGVYRLLSEVQDSTAVEAFVRRWLGPLLDYDARKHSELVLTLCRYLECGGNYDATAAAVSVHRSTLKYRLQRIREITGRDLNDPDTRFNLQLATRAWQTVEALRD